jgi:hypothetical protein
MLTHTLLYCDAFDHLLGNGYVNTLLGYAVNSGTMLRFVAMDKTRLLGVKQAVS